MPSYTFVATTPLSTTPGSLDQLIAQAEHETPEGLSAREQLIAWAKKKPEECRSSPAALFLLLNETREKITQLIAWSVHIHQTACLLSRFINVASIALEASASLTAWFRYVSPTIWLITTTALTMTEVMNFNYQKTTGDILIAALQLKVFLETEANDYLDEIADFYTHFHQGKADQYWRNIDHLELDTAGGLSNQLRAKLRDFREGNFEEEETITPKLALS